MNSLMLAYDRFREFHPHRKKELFTEFLPQGHALMTLSSVPQEVREEVILIKSLLGMLITLYDDLADMPDLENATLLAELYKIPFNNEAVNIAMLSDHERRYIDFAHYLTDQMMTKISALPSFKVYIDILQFDLLQFYNANNYYSLAQKHPTLLNSVEIRLIGPFNMGMIIAGTIDIMASPTFDKDELGSTRAILIFAQRFGHICNSLTTIKREIAENTLSNEALIITKEILARASTEAVIKKHSRGLEVLRQEQEIILEKLAHYATLVRSFNAQHYICRLKDLHELHERFLGII